MKHLLASVTKCIDELSKCAHPELAQMRLEQRSDIHQCGFLTEIAEGSSYTHSRLNANTTKTLEATAFLATRNGETANMCHLLRIT